MENEPLYTCCCRFPHCRIRKDCWAHMDNLFLVYNLFVYLYIFLRTHIYMYIAAWNLRCQSSWNLIHINHNLCKKPFNDHLINVYMETFYTFSSLRSNTATSCDNLRARLEPSRIFVRSKIKTNPFVLHASPPLNT